MSVNGMIDDVMEIGRSSKPTLEPNSIISIIETAIGELVQLYQKAEISITYDFNHTKQVNAECMKLLRVFSNILGNAIQAMNLNGEIYISTKENQDYTEIIIGNNGPTISEDGLKNLFEAFYTKNKKDGTGLGLAIAKKVINAHGGKIWCESPGKEHAVEFHFTLPTAIEKEIHTPSNLPKDSTEITNLLKPAKAGEKIYSSGIASDGKREMEYERAVVLSQYKEQGYPHKIAIIDDEPIYREAIVELIKNSDTLKSAITFRQYTSATKALEDLEIMETDYIICDIDMGPFSIDGFGFTQTIREKGYSGKICIHSNRSLPEDFKKANRAGADYFLPKPLCRVHLLKFICGAKSSGPKNNIITNNNNTLDSLSLPKIAIIDDEKLYSDAMIETMIDARVYAFESPEAFMKEAKKRVPTVTKKNRKILSRFLPLSEQQEVFHNRQNI